MAEFDWDHLQHGYAWTQARILTQKATWMLADYEKFYRAKEQNA